MCGRFAIHKTIKELEAFYHATALNVTFSSNFNLCPTELAPIITETGSNSRDLRLARFGIPMNINGKRFPLMNVQSEKADKRQEFQARRCIIPANGFYEWQAVTPKDKQPYYFSPKEGFFSFAGLWKPDGDGTAFTILTTGANDVVGPVHGRMPVILSHNAIGQWLDPASPKEPLLTLMQSYPASLMQAWKVSKAVNSPKNKEASCINSL